MRCDSRVVSAQNLIAEWALCFFYSFGGVICCFVGVFLIIFDIAEISTSRGLGRADQYYSNYD